MKKSPWYMREITIGLMWFCLVIMADDSFPFWIKYTLYIITALLLIKRRWHIDQEKKK